MSELSTPARDQQLQELGAKIHDELRAIYGEEMPFFLGFYSPHFGKTGFCHTCSWEVMEAFIHDLEYRKQRMKDNARLN